MTQIIESARLSVPSSELRPPHPLTHNPVLPPPLGPRGETHSLAGEGVGEHNSDEGTDIVVLYVYYNPSALSLRRSIKIRMLLILPSRDMKLRKGTSKK
jgi:hypothetical protein